eukprot:1620657-Rhodomonas_salina.1
MNNNIGTNGTRGPDKGRELGERQGRGREQERGCWADASGTSKSGSLRFIANKEAYLRKYDRRVRSPLAS